MNHDPGEGQIVEAGKPGDMTSDTATFPVQSAEVETIPTSQEGYLLIWRGKGLTQWYGSGNIQPTTAEALKGHTMNHDLTEYRMLKMRLPV